VTEEDDRDERITIGYSKNRNKRRISSLSKVFFGLILNGIGIMRLYESFERPDANNDGLFTLITGDYLWLSREDLIKAEDDGRRLQ
jgi:hypothetical protein